MFNTTSAWGPLPNHDAGRRSLRRAKDLAEARKQRLLPLLLGYSRDCNLQGRVEEKRDVHKKGAQEMFKGIPLTEVQSLAER